MCELTRCCTVFVKMKTLVFDDPKPPPEFGGSKTDISLLWRSQAHFHTETQHWAFHSFGYAHPQNQGHHMGESSRIEVYKSSRTEDSCEETSTNTSLVCSEPHTVLCLSSSLLPRNWADRVVVTESTYSSQNSEVTDRSRIHPGAWVMSIRRYGWGQNWIKLWCMSKWSIQ